MATQISDKFTQKYALGVGLFPIATGVLRRSSTGDNKDIGEDWWLPAHSSWGVVFSRAKDESRCES
jgi:hypothetical protein